MLAILAALWLFRPALASDLKPLEILESSPKAHEVLDGAAVAFSLKLSGPIDHRRSTALLKGAGDIRELRPRLGSAPQYIYLRPGHLDPGQYELTWKARSATGHVLRKTVPFTVK
jgi:methionine-rich copper-binding protein CopC